MNGVKVCPFGLILRQDGAMVSRNPLECLPSLKTAKEPGKMRKMPRGPRGPGGPLGAPYSPPWHCAAVQHLRCILHWFWPTVGKLWVRLFSGNNDIPMKQHLSRRVSPRNDQALGTEAPCALKGPQVRSWIDLQGLLHQYVFPTSREA